MTTILAICADLSLLVLFQTPKNGSPEKLANGVLLGTNYRVLDIERVSPMPPVVRPNVSYKIGKLAYRYLNYVSPHITSLK